jgi:hypothetical protein
MNLPLTPSQHLARASKQLELLAATKRPPNSAKLLKLAQSLEFIAALLSERGAA